MLKSIRKQSLFTSAIYPFRSSFAHDIFKQKYAHEGAITWEALARALVENVMRGLVPDDTVEATFEVIRDMKFIPGGRYLYYANRALRAYNNCYLFRSEEDSREDWARISWQSESALMTGGGIGNDYSIYRSRNSILGRTGGLASGPIPKMLMVNEIGRHVMQGGSRRSAIWAGLKWSHPDIWEFMASKNWYEMSIGNTGYTIGQIKEQDFNYPAPLDMTNISNLYDDAWLHPTNNNVTPESNPVFLENCRQACKTGEPGFAFNFGAKSNETLRNAPMSADTNVLTDDGYIRIGDIVEVETKVWTGKQWAATTFNKTATQVPTLTISMTGGREIKAEPSHEFLVERWVGAGSRRKLQAVERVPASALQVGDSLHVSMPAYDRQPLDDKAYTLGFLWGDGNFRGNRAEVSICTTDKTPCLAPIEASGWVSSVNRSDGRGYQRVYLVMPHAYNKEQLPNLLIEQVPSFIAGLFDADGNYNKSQSSIRLSAVNEDFLADIRRLLESIGISSNVSKNGSSTYGQRQTYQLVVGREYNSMFSDLVPTIRLNVPHHKAYRAAYTKVEAIQPGPIEDVFCCDVGVDEHSFMAEGVIVSNCTEITSEDDSDVCNLGSLNLSRIETTTELGVVAELATAFLLCGTVRATLPYPKIYKVREKNRRLGLGLMGVHEWLLQRGFTYEVTPELRRWLIVYNFVSDEAAHKWSNHLNVSHPVAVRSIAPTGTIGLIAGTTTGIEPLYAVAYKRRYLKNGTEWHYQYVVDSTAELLIEQYGLDPDGIETAVDLAGDVERRIKFQADVQDHVDMGISSTINLPPWGSDLNNEDRVGDFAKTLAKYAPRLRGFTCYPDGSRGGQPLTTVPYYEAKTNQGVEFKEHDSCKGGVCGI